MEEIEWEELPGVKDGKLPRTYQGRTVVYEDYLTNPVCANCVIKNNMGFRRLMQVENLTRASLLDPDEACECHYGGWELSNENPVCQPR